MGWSRREGNQYSKTCHIDRRRRNTYPKELDNSKEILVAMAQKRNYMSAREDFLFLTKTEKYTFNIPYTSEKSGRKDLGANGKPRINEYKRVSNVWNDITEASQSSIERCWHPTVKAQKLCDRIIETHSNEGDTVLVPLLVQVVRSSVPSTIREIT